MEFSCHFTITSVHGCFLAFYYDVRALKFCLCVDVTITLELDVIIAFGTPTCSPTVGPRTCGCANIVAGIWTWELAWS